MDAWANVSHYLEYKGEASIPESLRRNFHALSGLFYVADQNFQALYDASDRADRQASVQTHDATSVKVPINRATVRALLRDLYPDRDPSDLSSVSEFTEEVAEAGFESISDLAAVLTRADSLVKEYERRFPPHGRTGTQFWDVGLARNALAIADPSYASGKYRGLEYDTYHEQFLKQE